MYKKSIQFSRVELYGIAVTLASYKNVLTFQKVFSSAVYVCVYVCVAVVDQTEGFVPAGQVFYHWAPQKLIYKLSSCDTVFNNSGAKNSSNFIFISLWHV